MAALASSSCMREGPDIDPLIQPGIETGYPGVAVVIKMPDRSPQYAVAGVADIEKQELLESGACFHIGSITKLFTALAVLQLVDERRVALDAKLTELLDPAVVGQIPFADEISIEQLLDHSSGIYATNNDSVYIADLIGENADPSLIWQPRQFIARAYEGVNDPFAVPGEGHYYSDTNYILLGMIIERASGRSFKAHITETLFKPLGMDETRFVSDQIVAGNALPGDCVQGYVFATQELREAVTIGDIFEPVPGKPVPAGELLNTSTASERIDAAAGVFSTLDDLLLFAEALFAGELLSASSQGLLMAAGEVAKSQPIGAHHQRIFQAERHESGVIVHKSGDGPGGVTAELALHLESGTIFVGFTNSFGHFSEADYLLNDVFGAFIAAEVSN